MRSPRFRVPQGYDDEARVAFKTGNTTWGVGGLYREKGRAPFADEELQVLGSIAHAVGVSLRARSVLHSPMTWSAGAPGVMLFDVGGKLIGQPGGQVVAERDLRS